MTPEEENTQMTEAVGLVIGEVLSTVAQMIGALRSQPNFDNDAFNREIRAIAENPETGELQKHAMNLLLRQRPPEQ